MNSSGEFVGSWRRTRDGRWVVAIDAGAVNPFNGRAVVKVRSRSGRYENVTLWKVGSSFVDSRTKKLTVYGYPCARVATAVA